MPKTNDGGSTAAGSTGIVEHGAPLPDGRLLSELDPERNLDGTLIEGEHPDHEDGEEREAIAPTDPRPIDEPAEPTPVAQPERTAPQQEPAGNRTAQNKRK